MHVSVCCRSLWSSGTAVGNLISYEEVASILASVLVVVGCIADKAVGIFRNLLSYLSIRLLGLRLHRAVIGPLPAVFQAAEFAWVMLGTK